MLHHILCYSYLAWLVFKSLLLDLIDLVRAKQPKSIQDKVVLITGGAKGLGRSIAQCLVPLGCKIAILDVDETNGEKTAKELASLGGKVKFYSIDVSDFNELQKLRPSIERDLGPIDILINNAAVLFCDSIVEASPEYLQKFVNINLLSNFWTTKVFLPSMIERRSGHIVSISSALVLVPIPREVALITTKHGVSGFMNALKLDLHQNGHEFVKTSTVYPYFIRTRSDLVDSYSKKVRVKAFDYMTLGSQEAAQKIVEGILLDKCRILIPDFYHFWGYLMSISDRLVPYFMDWVYDRDAECPNRPQGRFLEIEDENFVIPGVMNKYCEKIQWT